MADSPEFVVVYLAAMRIGAVPVPVSTMLRADGLAELVHDSRAVLVTITPEFAELASGGRGRRAGAHGRRDLPTPTATTPCTTRPRTRRRSGSTPPGTTGLPKGAMHRHGSIRVVCETYGTQVLGIRPDDRCLSAAKAFFAYGLGNSVLFPLVGRRGGGARAGAVASGRRSSSARRRTARRCSSPARRSSRTCCAPSCPRDALARRAARGVGGRAAARGAVPPVDHALRRRHPRRHRDDRDAAHLPVQPRGRGQARDDRGRRARLRPAHRRRGRATTSRRERRARCSSAATRRRPATGRATPPRARCSRASGCAPATPTSRTRTATTPASAAPATCSRPAGSGCRRPRSRAACSRTTPSRRPSSSPRPTRTGWRSRSPTSCSQAGASVDRGRARSRSAATGCRRSSGRAASCSSTRTRPPRPARSAASSCARRPPTVLTETAPVSGVT